MFQLRSASSVCSCQEQAFSLLQAALVDFAAVERIAQAGDTVIERLCAIFKQYPDRTCFGVASKAKPEWQPVSYKEVWERIQVSSSACSNRQTVETSLPSSCPVSLHTGAYPDAW